MNRRRGGRTWSGHRLYPPALPTDVPATQRRNRPRAHGSSALAARRQRGAGGAVEEPRLHTRGPRAQGRGTAGGCEAACRRALPAAQGSPAGNAIQPIRTPRLARTSPAAAFRLRTRGRQRSGSVPGSSSFPGSQARITLLPGQAATSPDSRQLTARALCSLLFAIARDEESFPVLPEGSRAGAEQEQREQERRGAQLGVGGTQEWGGCSWGSASGRGARMPSAGTAPQAGRSSPRSAPSTHTGSGVHASAPGSAPGGRAAPRAPGRPGQGHPAPPRSPEPVLSEGTPAHTVTPCGASLGSCFAWGRREEDRTCFMGMARPLPILSALHSGTFFSRSGSAPFRDWKRRDTGLLERGAGETATHGPAIPGGLPEQPTLPQAGSPSAWSSRRLARPL